MPDTGQVPNLIQDRRKSVVWAILGAIILGAIGSGLWDMLAKPGLGTVGRLLLNIVTLGSKTIRDAAYSSAALNPTALPSLILLAVGSFLPLYLAFRDFFKEYITPVVKKRVEQGLSKVEAETQVTDTAIDNREAKEARRQEWLKKRRRRWTLVLIAIYILLFVESYGAATIINQAILIHRVFNADLAICTPYISDLDEKRFRARFSVIKSREDYLLIDSDLRSIAASNGCSLVDMNLW